MKTLEHSELDDLGMGFGILLKIEILKISISEG